MKKRAVNNNFQRIKKTSKYPFLAEIIKTWKPRAKSIKLDLKDLAALSNISPQHFSKVITGACENPKIETINAVEMALKAAEIKAEV
jgi:hypothetical protein